MHKRQAGITFIGWIILLIPVAIVLYAGIRLVPIYLTHMKVVKTIEQAAEEARGESTVNAAEVKRSITRRLDIEGVEFPAPEDIRVAREGEGWVIESSYERTTPLFGGIELLVSFEKRETVP